MVGRSLFSSAGFIFGQSKFQIVLGFDKSCIYFDCFQAEHIIIISFNFSIQADWGHYSVCGPPSLGPRCAGYTLLLGFAHPPLLGLPPRDLHFSCKFPPTVWAALTCSFWAASTTDGGGSDARCRAPHSTGIFRTADSAMCCSERTRYHLLKHLSNSFALPQCSSAKSRKVTCGQKPVWEMFAKMAEKYLHLAWWQFCRRL